MIDHEVTLKKKIWQKLATCRRKWLSLVIAKSNTWCVIELNLHVLFFMAGATFINWCEMKATLSTLIWNYRKIIYMKNMSMYRSYSISFCLLEQDLHKHLDFSYPLHQGIYRTWITASRTAIAWMGLYNHCYNYVCTYVCDPALEYIYRTKSASKLNCACMIR